MYYRFSFGDVVIAVLISIVTVWFLYLMMRTAVKNGVIRAYQEMEIIPNLHRQKQRASEREKKKIDQRLARDGVEGLVQEEGRLARHLEVKGEAGLAPEEEHLAQLLEEEYRRSQK